MGMIVEVYRGARGGDCTNGGITAKYDALTVVNVDGPFEPTPERPAVLLTDDRPCGKPYPKLIPAVLVDGTYEPLKGNGVGPMAGGNFAGTTDSRFRKEGMNPAGILPVHDRFEGWDEYEALCN